MPSRRSFIGWTLKAVAFLAAGGTLLRPVRAMSQERWGGPVEPPKAFLHDRDPAEIDSSKMEVTPFENFRTMGQTSAGLDVNTWRLEVSGLVEKPLSLSYRDIKERPAVERKVLIICPGFFTYVGLWKGIEISPLLEEAGLKEGAAKVAFQGPPDRGLTKEYDLEDLRTGKVFLAWGVNGQNLPEQHGFPLRVVAEGQYGYDWVKYVSLMEVK